jgi:hypothetical protein
MLCRSDPVIQRPVVNSFTERKAQPSLLAIGVMRRVKLVTQQLKPDTDSRSTTPRSAAVKCC